MCQSREPIKKASRNYFERKLYASIDLNEEVIKLQ